MHPAGLALKVGPQNLLLDLGAILGDLFPDGMFDGITMPIPSVEFREPGTPLEVLESFHAESTVDVTSVTPTASQFAGGSELPYDPDEPGLFQDFYTGFRLRFLTGSLTDEIREVAAYDAATRTFAFTTPFSGAPAAGDLFELVRISTEPVTLALDLIEFDNHLDPGDIMTVSPNPVSELVRLAESVASGQVVSVPAPDQLIGENQPDDIDQLSDEDDAYNGLTLVLTSGSLVGERVAIADYVGATHTFQLQAPLSGTPAAGTTFEVFDESAALDEQVFLFDTGAQLSVISTAEADALGLLAQPPEFKASVQGAGGIVADLPGYTLDELSIPTLEGGRLVLRNAPVFVLDVAPMLDGILGMNLFNNAAEFLYDPFDPVHGYPTLQVTFFEERAEVVTGIDVEGANAATLQAVADLMPLAFGQAVGLREISMPSYGVGVDLDLTPRDGAAWKENGVTVVTAAPGAEIRFTAEVSYTAESYDAVRLDLAASDDALGLRDWTTGTDWTASDGTLAVPGDPDDAVVSMAGSAQWKSTLGTFIVDAPAEPGNYVLTADDGAGGTAFWRTDELVAIRDFGSIVIRVQPTPALALSGATVVEGDAGTPTDAEFSVTLAGVAGGTVAVDYATADGTAQLGDSDYTARSGTVEFAPGETQKTITVPVTGDVSPEADEDFFVVLSNARIDTGPVVLTPASDATGVDVDGDLSFDYLETGPADVVELRADGGLLAPPLRGFALEFDLSVIPAGAAISSAVLTFVETIDTVTSIDVHGYVGNSDGAVTLAHPFNIPLDNNLGSVGGGGAGTETLDVTSFIQQRKANSDRWAGFYVQSSDSFFGSEQYAIHSREAASAADRPTLTITFGSLPTTIEIATDTGQATIRNDDTQISISDRQLAEGDAGQTQATFVVQLSHPSAQEVSVDYATADGTAHAGDDYQPASGKLAFAPGETAKSISVPIRGDSLAEPSETFFVELSDPSGATIDVGTGTGTIANDDPLVGLQVVAVREPSAPGSNGLPSSVAAVQSGSTYYVEVWVQDLLTPGVGISGGKVDVGYTTTIVDALTVVNQDFSLLPDGTIDDPNGVVQDLGGGTLSGGLGVAPQWVRLGYVEVLATGLGEAAFVLSPGELQFSRFGLGNVAWSDVDLGTPLTVDQMGEAQIEMTIVETPSATGGNGEVAPLPASRAWVHEWMPFWVEIWIRTPDTTASAIAEAAVDLQYNTAYLTATEIQYGPAFTQDLTGTIDDALGVVSAIGGATALTDVGDDAYVLLARVRFASTGSDQVPVDEVGRNIGPYDMQLALANGQTQLVGGGAALPDLAPPPATELWAVMYDIDDNNLIDFGDLSYFAPAFGRSVGLPASEPPYAWWADFDKSGLVDFGDLSFFAPNFGKGRASGQAIVFPPDFPVGWAEAPDGGQGEAFGAGAVAASAGGAAPNGLARLAERPGRTDVLPSWPKIPVASVARTDPRSAPAGHTRAADQVFAQIAVAGTRRTPAPVFTPIAADPDALTDRLAELWEALELEDVLPLLAGADSGDALADAGRL